MSKAWQAVIAAGLMSGLMACSTTQKPMESVDTAPSYQPCMVPSTLPDNAIGKLGIRMIRIGDSMRIIIPSDNVFELRSSEIRDSAKPGLTELSNDLWSYRNLPMTIRGYTDELGSAKQDRLLGKDQARSIQSFLWTQGYCHQFLTPIGVGKALQGQVANNRTPLGSMANRRIEITFRVQPGTLDSMDHLVPGFVTNFIRF